MHINSNGQHCGPSKRPYKLQLIKYFVVILLSNMCVETSDNK